ncbi:putative pathogenicity protein CRX2 [Fusarium austroafricanum]|uniref:Putative pathogenicity protein CRX2 n=1 Tax=Fusarium austroafricanum TaxID=2364996 RepID=A0A8H4JNB3_9HYPO|nr:putative pathogenicity protein CRX2 [Fusarium austroafricanum]
MAEVIGLVSGLLTLATFAHKSVTKVQEAVQSIRTLPRQLRELLSELAELSTVLQDLSQAPGGGIEVDLSALKTTLEQCSRSCEEFEQELRACSSRSGQDRASFRDWAKLTYRGGDGIEGFRQQLIGYKSTIIVALSFANLRTSTITVEAIQSCRGLIETTTIDLEAHLADVKQKLDALACRAIASPEPDEATIRYIENERISTEKGLQFCLQLSQHIDQIQLQFAAEEGHTPSLLGPHPTSNMLVSEGLGGCKDYIGFALERLRRHRQKVSERIGAGSSTTVSPDDKILLDNLNDEAEALRHSLNLFSNIDTYLEEKISNIENHAEGDDTIQFMVSTDGKPLNGKNHGVGSRLKQAGGHFKEQSLQQISQDFTTISLHQTGGKKPSRNASSPAAQSETTTESLDTPFNGRGFTLTPKPDVRSTPSSRSTTA